MKVVGNIGNTIQADCFGKPPLGDHVVGSFSTCY